MVKNETSTFRYSNSNCHCFFAPLVFSDETTIVEISTTIPLNQGNQSSIETHDSLKSYFLSVGFDVEREETHPIWYFEATTLATGNFINCNVYEKKQRLQIRCSELWRPIFPVFQRTFSNQMEELMRALSAIIDGDKIFAIEVRYWSGQEGQINW